MQSDQFQLHAIIEEKHWWFLGRRKIMCDLIQRITPASQAVTIADIGCGTGGNIAALSQSYSCIGIDPSDEAIRFATSRFPHVRFICNSVSAVLAELKEYVQLFLLMDVLEHIPYDVAFLSDLLMTAKPNTYFLITVPADLSLWSEHDVSFGHYRRYDLKHLEQLCKAGDVKHLFYIRL